MNGSDMHVNYLDEWKVICNLSGLENILIEEADITKKNIIFLLICLNKLFYRTSSSKIIFYGQEKMFYDAQIFIIVHFCQL